MNRETEPKTPTRVGWSAWLGCKLVKSIEIILHNVPWVMARKTVHVFDCPHGFRLSFLLKIFVWSLVILTPKPVNAVTVVGVQEMLQPLNCDFHIRFSGAVKMLNVCRWQLCSLLSDENTKLVFFRLDPVLAAVVDGNSGRNSNTDYGDTWDNVWIQLAQIFPIWLLVDCFIIWQDAESRAALHHNIY